MVCVHSSDDALVSLCVVWCSGVRAMSWWAAVPQGPKDPILGVTEVTRTHTFIARIVMRYRYHAHTARTILVCCVVCVQAFKEDKDPRKMNLGVGAYRDDNNKPVVIKSVREAAKRIHEANLNNEYAPIAGEPDFSAHAVALAYGRTPPAHVHAWLLCSSLHPSVNPHFHFFCFRFLGK